MTTKNPHDCRSSKKATSSKAPIHNSAPLGEALLEFFYERAVGEGGVGVYFFPGGKYFVFDLRVLPFEVEAVDWGHFLDFHVLNRCRGRTECDPCHGSG